MNKKKLLALVLGAMLTAGIAFNFATTATYRENLGTETQTLMAGNWDVDMGNGLKSHTIFPGDVVGEDTITLENKNDYAVKYTVSLTTTGDIEFDGALDLELLKNGVPTGVVNPEGTVEIIVKSGEEPVVLNSKVTWNPSTVENEDIKYEGKTVNYNYSVVAEAYYPRINLLNTHYDIIDYNGALRVKDFNNSGDLGVLLAQEHKVLGTGGQKAVETNYKFNGEVNNVSLKFDGEKLLAIVNGKTLSYDTVNAPENVETALFVLKGYENNSYDGDIKVDNIRVNGINYRGSLTQMGNGEIFFDVPVSYEDGQYTIEFDLYLLNSKDKYQKSEYNRVEVRVGKKAQ